MLDIGCGNGGWLKAWKNVGAKEILGVDGAYVDTKKLHISKDDFLAHDLTTPLKLKRKFDLAMTLEVGEHIDTKYSKVFVKSLVQHADVVFFSAALPGQGGTHHVNEQWPSFWAKLFAANGYKAYDVLRPLVWEDEKIEVWYRQNCMIFATDAAAKKLKLTPTGGPLDIVHPEMFLQKVNHLGAVAGQLDALSRQTKTDSRAKLKETLNKTPLGPPLRKVNNIVNKRKR